MFIVPESIMMRAVYDAIKRVKKPILAFIELHSAKEAKTISANSGKPCRITEIFATDNEYQG